MNIELYKVSEIHQHRYYKVPKDLFEFSKYKYSLNSDAKILYALLLDRMELSKENGWINSKNEIFLIFTRDNLCEMLGLCRNTMTKAFKQLSEAGLIIEKRQGQGLPNLIFIGKIQREMNTAQNPSNKQEDSSQVYPHYPQNPQQPQIQQNRYNPHYPQAVNSDEVSEISDSQNLRIKKRKFCESRFPKNECLDSQNLRTNETDSNETNSNETNSNENILPKQEYIQSVSKDEFQDERQENYSSSEQLQEKPSANLTVNKADEANWVNDSDKKSEVEELNEILNKCELHIFQENKIQLIFIHALEIMFFSEFVKVGTAKIPQCMVRSRMYKLNGAILSYALEKVKNRNGPEIRNSTNYLIAAIYNAISEYYSDPELDSKIISYFDPVDEKINIPWEGE